MTKYNIQKSGLAPEFNRFRQSLVEFNLHLNRAFVHIENVFYNRQAHTATFA